MPLSRWSLEWARADLGKSGTAENPAERQGDPSAPEVKRRVTDSPAAPTAAAPLFLFFSVPQDAVFRFPRRTTALLASLWGIFNEFFIDCKAARYYRRRSFSEAFTQTASKRTVSGPIVLYPSRCAVGRGDGGAMTTVGYCSQLSSQIQQRRCIIFLRHGRWPGKGKEKEKAFKALHVPVNMLQSFCIYQLVISPVACRDFAPVGIDPLFFFFF